MLYEALTGRLPFGGTPFQVLMDKQKREPPAPNELAIGIPDDLNNLCVALLRRSPEARPAGHQVLESLGNASLSPERPVAFRSLQTQPCERPCFRRQLRALCA